MTTPTPSGPATSGGPADYTPANTADSTGTPSGPVSIWNIPKVLRGNKLWFDNNGTETHFTPDNQHGGYTESKSPKGQWYYPNRIYNYVYALAAQADVRDKHGKPTPAAQDALNKYLEIQQALGSGPWGKVYTSGSFDVSTQRALGNALTQFAQESASGKAQPFTEWLTEQAQKARNYGGYPGSKASAAPTPPTISLTDPDAIKQQAQAAAQQALGASLSEDQLNAFVSQFQAAQTKYQSAPAGTTVTAPDLSADATAYAQTAAPGAYQQNQHQSYLDALVNLFSGPGATARPNMTPVPKAT